MRLVIVGTLPPPICGTTVSLGHLVDDIRQRRRDVDLSVLDTSHIRGRGLSGIVRLLRTVGRLFEAARKCDVIALHLGPYAVPWLGAYSLLLCRLFGPRLVVRLFGGVCLTERSGVRGWLFRFVLRRSTYLAQTHSMVDVAKRQGLPRVRWFPTSRPLMEGLIHDNRSKDCRKFVYAGWVSPDKGIPELIQAGARLKIDGLTVDVFGVPAAGIAMSDFDHQRTVRYQGVLTPGTVGRKLIEYDALIFPSHYIGEGYPGVIVEAFHAGLPVIATRWRHIPELVNDTCGILFEPKDVSGLTAAIERMAMDRGMFQELREGVRAQSDRFATTTWTDKFLDYCRE